MFGAALGKSAKSATLVVAAEGLRDVHASMRRLLEFAREVTAGSAKPVRSFTDIGKRLGVQSAVVTNWKARGISCDGAIQAERAFGCLASWVVTGEGSPTPAARGPQEHWRRVADELARQLHAHGVEVDAARFLATADALTEIAAKDAGAAELSALVARHLQLAR